MVSAWQKCQYHTDAYWAHSLNTLWWTQLECALHSDQLTHGHIRMGTAPSQPHSPSQHSLPTNHCTLHACSPLSAASHMTTLLGGRSLGVACGVICRGCSPLHSPTAEWLPQGGRRPPHFLCSPRTTPTRVDQYRRTPQNNWYVCMCVLCVWTTGASLAVTTHRVVAVWG